MWLRLLCDTGLNVGIDLSSRDRLRLGKAARHGRNRRRGDLLCRLLCRASPFDARLLGLHRDIRCGHRSSRWRLGGLTLYSRILRSDGGWLRGLLRCGLRLLDALVRLRRGVCRLPTQLRTLFSLTRYGLGGRRSLNLVRFNRDLGFWSRSRLTLGRRFGLRLLLQELLHLRFGNFGFDGTEQILRLIWLRLELNRVVIRLDQKFAFDSRIRQLGKLVPQAAEDINFQRNDEEDQVNDNAQHGGELNTAAHRTTLDLPQPPDHRTQDDRNDKQPRPSVRVPPAFVKAEIRQHGADQKAAEYEQCQHDGPELVIKRRLCRPLGLSDYTTEFCHAVRTRPPLPYSSYNRECLLACRG